MLHLFVRYDSKNGIRFQHAVNTHENGVSASVVPETHDLCEIFLLLRGKLTYFIEGKQYRPQPMDLILISPNELHSLKVDPSEPYERFVLQFSFDLLPKFKDIDLLAPFKQAKHLSHLIPRKLVEQTQLLTHFNTLKQIVTQKSPVTDLHVVRILHNVMAELLMLPENTTLIGQVGQSTMLTVYTISQKCMQYVNDHIHLPLTAKDIANALNLSASHLQSTFKQEIGMPLHKYIVTQKIHLAAQMILNGSTPQEASDALGYTYYKSFYRNFRQIMSYPPSWRPFYHQRRWVDNQTLDPIPPKQ